jgi:putative transposase
MVELCKSFEVSRKTGYKWTDRFEEGGESALGDRSRRPKTHPQAMSERVQQLVLEERVRHPTWGPRKLLARLGRQHRGLALPAPSTVGDLLRKRGLIKPRVRRSRAQGSSPLAESPASNAVFAMDFKGWFKTGDGARCNPLTVTDNYSRYLLACQHLDQGTEEAVRHELSRVFNDYGVPAVMRSDNGSPFASTGLCGLSRLAVWLIRLGITVERIAPGKPQQNGRHERMHRTLKQETAHPPKATLLQQQRAFDRFRHEYNWERPHAALNNRPPGTVYVRSSRLYPRVLPTLDYGAQIVRGVRNNGTIRWNGGLVYVSEALIGEQLGLEPIDDGLWLVSFGRMHLGVLDDETSEIDPDWRSYMSTE